MSVAGVQMESLMSVFSGCDTTLFMDGKKTECMYFIIGKNNTEIVLPINTGIEGILNNEKVIMYDLVSVNDAGRKGLISGKVKVLDWKMNLSIDELLFEVKISAVTTLDKVIGHLDCRPEIQEEINNYMAEKGLKL